MTRPVNRRRDERGTALVEVTWLSILLMVPLVYVVLTVFEVQRGAFAVTAASRAAGRAYALAGDDATGRSRAEVAARLALRDQGIEGAPLDLDVRCAPEGACHAAGSVVTVTVRSRVDLPLLPDVLGGGSPSFRLDSTHSVPIGRFNVPDAP